MGVEVARLDCLFPVRWATKGIVDFEQGMTLEDIAPLVTTSGNWGAIVNGRNVHRDEWLHYRVTDGSQVIFTPLPENIAAVGAAFGKLVAYLVGSLAINIAVSKILGVPEVELHGVVGLLEEAPHLEVQRIRHDAEPAAEDDDEGGREPLDASSSMR